MATARDGRAPLPPRCAVLVIIVVFWGAVFGIGIIDPDPVCDLNASDPAITITFHKTAQCAPHTEH